MSRLARTLLTCAAFGFAGCATVGLDDIELMDDTAFSEEVSNLEMSYPSLGETPDMPTEIRSGKAWDVSARELQRLGDTMDVPPLAPSLSEPEFDREFEAAQRRTNEYKADDPQ
ncbi:MAG: hypothetical protein WBF53_14860 [Litorimonas sp.]